MSGGPSYQTDPAVIDLAQRLMAEITARLEDLATLAAGRQRAIRSSPEIAASLRATLTLAEAHETLLQGSGERVATPALVGRRAMRRPQRRAKD